jgi:hypothetical protein
MVSLPSPRDRGPPIGDVVVDRAVDQPFGAAAQGAGRRMRSVTSVALSPPGAVRSR